MLVFWKFWFPDCAEPGGTQCPKGLGETYSVWLLPFMGFVAVQTQYQKRLVATGYREAEHAISVVNNTGCQGEKYPCSGHGECGPDGVCYIDYFSRKVGCDLGWVAQIAVSTQGNSR